MYAVGHFALGYLTGKLTAKSLNVNVNIPLLFLLSVFPDVDLLIPGLMHRGPLHSVVLFCILFLPIFAVYKKRAVPYFVALLQHIVIGDYLIGGNLQLLWPLTSNLYGFSTEVGGLMHVSLEWGLFLISMLFMVRTRDIFLLFKPQKSNIVLSIPILSVLLPTIISFPVYVPLSLLIPHVIYLILFIIPLVIALKMLLTKAVGTTGF